ncbi:hypothetical protein [Gordonia hydrophobica]|uniref:Lipoprotein n=1 Tax=Gordonia hydrophobica TaxID=40516 RepID=A0ABZ2U3M8_9ACTN|nr:hypothetical protein [Gordonia hydrophobica]MBM7367914.1 hypothetical protein [Gordonia hydrophobica]
MALAGAALATACGSDTAPSTDASTPPGISAVTPPAAGTSTITITSVPLTPDTSSAVDVDPADYTVDGHSGRYRWSYSRKPLRECALTTATDQVPPQVTCSAPYPPEAPTISVDGFTAAPNAVVLTGEGARATIIEGGPEVAKPLPAGKRLTVGGLSCTALPHDSISCTASDAWFTVENGVLRTS